MICLSSENLSMETNEAESSLVHTNTLQVEDAIEKLEEAIAEGGFAILGRTAPRAAANLIATVLFHAH